MVLLAGCSCCQSSCENATYSRGGGGGTRTDLYSFPVSQRYVKFEWRWSFVGERPNPTLTKYIVKVGDSVVYDSGTPGSALDVPQADFCFDKIEGESFMTVTVVQQGSSNFWRYSLVCGGCTPNPLP